MTVSRFIASKPQTSRPTMTCLEPHDPTRHASKTFYDLEQPTYTNYVCYVVKRHNLA